MAMLRRRRHQVRGDMLNAEGLEGRLAPRSLSEKMTSSLLRRQLRPCRLGWAPTQPWMWCQSWYLPWVILTPVYLPMNPWKTMFYSSLNTWALALSKFSLNIGWTNESSGYARYEERREQRLMGRNGIKQTRSVCLLVAKTKPLSNSRS